MSTGTIAARRLASLGVSPAVAGDPAAAVRALGAMQAQDYQSALWAVGLRTPGSTLADVEAAVARGAIVRTWPMRGTLHFVAAEDVWWLLALLTPRVLASTARRRQGLGLDTGALAAGRALVEVALADGPVARPALFSRLKSAGFEPGGQRGYHLLLYLAMIGVVCQGPSAGKQPTFTLLEEWVGPAVTLPREEALRRLALRYFSGHGPATERDLAWWCGLTLKDCRAGIAAASDGLRAETCDGVVHLDVPREDSVSGRVSGGGHLLPAFDEHLLGYADRGVCLDPAHARRVSPGGGVFRRTVVVGGQVVGTWTRARRSRSVQVTVERFDGAPNDEAALGAALTRYGVFSGVEARWSASASPPPPAP